MNNKLVLFEEYFKISLFRAVLSKTFALIITIIVLEILLELIVINCYLIICCRFLIVLYSTLAQLTNN